MFQSRYIILRKTPYQENSLIISGLSEKYGKADFLLKGVRGIGAKKFPWAELFREQEIEFHEPAERSTLFRLKSRETLAIYDSVAQYTGNYLYLCSIAQFLLKHTAPMMELPMTYAALRTLLRRCTEKEQEEFLFSLCKMVYLHECGMLPWKGSAGQLQELIQYACTPEVPETELSTEWKIRFQKRVDELCYLNDLH